MIDISLNLTHVIVLAALKAGYSSPAEIFRVAAAEGINGLEYSNISKILSMLASSGDVQEILGTLELTDDGRAHFQKRKDDLRDLVDLLEKDQWSLSSNQNVNTELLHELLVNCREIKLIPYSIRYLPNGDDSFFLQELPKKNWIYEFEGRGLGKGNFQDDLMLFVNSGYVFFAGIADSYDNEKKELRLKPDTVKKFSRPISAKDIEAKLGEPFKFIRNKQTFSSAETVEKMIDLVECHL